MELNFLAQRLRLVMEGTIPRLKIIDFGKEKITTGMSFFQEQVATHDNVKHLNNSVTYQKSE